MGSSPTLPGKMTFRVGISTEPDPQGTGRVDIHTQPHTTKACAAGVATGTADRDSSLLYLQWDPKGAPASVGL